MLTIFVCSYQCFKMGRDKLKLIYFFSISFHIPEWNNIYHINRIIIFSAACNFHYWYNPEDSQFPETNYTTNFFFITRFASFSSYCRLFWREESQSREGKWSCHWQNILVLQVRKARFYFFFKTHHMSSSKRSFIDALSQCANTQSPSSSQGL